MVKVAPKFDPVYTRSLVKERIPTVEEIELFEKKFPEIANWARDQCQSLPPRIVPLPKPTLKRKMPTVDTPLEVSENLWTQKAIEQLALLEKFAKTGDPKNKNLMFKLFFQPVDPVSMECFDYFDVIKKPMDFGTVTGYFCRCFLISKNFL